MRRCSSSAFSAWRRWIKAFRALPHQRPCLIQLSRGTRMPVSTGWSTASMSLVTRHRKGCCASGEVFGLALRVDRENGVACRSRSRRILLVPIATRNRWARRWHIKLLCGQWLANDAHHDGRSRQAVHLQIPSSSLTRPMLHSPPDHSLPGVRHAVHDRFHRRSPESATVGHRRRPQE